MTRSAPQNHNTKREERGLWTCAPGHDYNQATILFVPGGLV